MFAYPENRWPHWNALLYGDAEGNTRKDIWRWWANRRWRYNVIVGIVGFITWCLVLIAGSASVKSGIDFEEPLLMLIGPPLYALMANLCYTVGPLIAITVCRNGPGKLLFRAGLFFSIGLTALPGIWALFAWLSSLATGRKLD